MKEGGRCVRLTTLPPSCAVVAKSGDFNFWNPLGPSRPVTGLLYLYLSTLVEAVNLAVLFTVHFIRMMESFCRGATFMVDIKRFSI